MKQLSNNAKVLLAQVRAGQIVVPFHGMDVTLTDTLCEIIRHLDSDIEVAIRVDPEIQAFRSWVTEFEHVLFGDCQLPATEQKVIATAGLGYYAAWCIKVTEQQP